MSEERATYGAMVGAITLWVPGRPVPKARPRVVNGRTYTPERTHQHEEMIGWALREQCPSLAVDSSGTWSVFARFQRPRKGADIDNLTKTVLDALNGLVWRDDRQVEHIEAMVQWDGEPGTYISLTALS